MGKFLTCLVRKVTAAVDTVNEKRNHTEQLQSFVPEAVPDDIDKIPTLGDIGRCGFTTARLVFLCLAIKSSFLLDIIISN